MIMTKKLLITGISFLILYIFIAVSVMTASGWVNHLDLYFIEAIQSTVTDSRAALILVMTEIGGTEAIVVLTLIVTVSLFIKKMYTAALWFGLTISLSPGVLVHLMKPVIGRERPEFLRLAAESTYSFPSGHSTASTVFYGMLGLILILSVQKLWKKIIIAFITVTIILFVMASRIYLGVHFPTDVLAGFSFGAATVLLSLSLYHLALPKFSQWLRSKDITDKSLSLFQ